MKINRYVLFLINTLETIVKGLNVLSKYSLEVVVYLLHAAGEYCILLMS